MEKTGKCPIFPDYLPSGKRGLRTVTSKILGSFALLATLTSLSSQVWATDDCETGTMQNNLTTFTCTEGPYEDGIRHSVPSPDDAKLIIGAEDGADVIVRRSTDDNRYVVVLTGNGNVEVVVGHNAKIETYGSGGAAPIANAANLYAHTSSTGSGATKVVLSGRFVMGSSAFYDNGAARRQTGLVVGAGSAENEGGVHVVLREGSAIEHAPSGIDGHAGGHGIHADTWGIGNVQVETEAGSMIDTSAEGGWGILGWIFTSTSTADVIITHGGTISTSVKHNGPDGFKGVGIVGAHRGSGAITITSAGEIETVQAPGIVAYAGGAENDAGHTVTVSGGSVTTHGSTAIQALHTGRVGAFTITVAEGATITANTDTRGASCAPDCVADDATLREILDYRTLPEEKSYPGPWWEIEYDTDGNILSYAPRVRGISILRGGTLPPDGAPPMDRVEVHGSVIATGPGSVGIHLPRGGTVIIGTKGEVRGGMYGIDANDDTTVIVDGKVSAESDVAIRNQDGDTGSAESGAAIRSLGGEIVNATASDSVGIRLSSGGTVIVSETGEVHGGKYGIEANGNTKVTVEGQVSAESGVAIRNSGGNLDVTISEDVSVEGKILNDVEEGEEFTTTLTIGGEKVIENDMIRQSAGRLSGVYDTEVITTDGGFQLSKVFAPRAFMYESLPQTLQTLNRLPTRRERTIGQTEVGPIWLRLDVGSGSREPESSTTSASWDMNHQTIQAGLDFQVRQRTSSQMTASLSTHYNTASSEVSGPSSLGGGEITTTGYGFSASLVWRDDEGTYVDGQGAVSWYDSNLSGKSRGRLKSGVGGSGYSYALEMGQHTELEGMSLVPHARLAYSQMNLDDFKDIFGNSVSLEKSSSLTGLLGVAFEGKSSWASVALERELGNGKTTVDVEGVKLQQKMEQTRFHFGIGGSTSMVNGIALHGTLSIATDLENFADQLEYKVGASVSF